MLDDATAREAQRIGRWYICQDRNLKWQAMVVGGVEDVVQEALMRLIRTTQDQTPRYKLSTLVCQSVRWALSWMLYNHRRFTRSTREPQRQRLAQYLACPATHEQLVEQQDLSEFVRLAFKQLPLSYRQRWVLNRRIEEATYREIAEELGVSPARVAHLEHTSLRALMKHENVILYYRLERAWLDSHPQEPIREADR